MRLDIAMHDSLRMAKVKCLQNLKNVVPNVKVTERFVKCTEVNITSVYEFHNKSGCLSHWVTNYVEQINDVDTILECLKNLNLSSNLGLFHCKNELTSTAYLA